MLRKARQPRKPRKQHAYYQQCLASVKSFSLSNYSPSFLEHALCRQLYHEVLFSGDAEGMFPCFQPSSVLGNKSKRKERLKEETLSLSVSAQLKDIMVRIVHAGGRIEMYHNAFPAYKLIQKYPDMCITWPDVFKRPRESLLSADDILLPGHKYFLMRRSALEKLMHGQSRRGRTNGPAVSDEPILKSEEFEDVGDICFEESICSARDFFVSKESWSSFAKKHVKEKPFVPPIQRRRLPREPEWEPSLTSIQELSP